MTRIDRQLPNYEACPLYQLRKFVTDRKILPNPNIFTHKDLARILKAADDDVQFTRLLDLPPELRCNIYSWYMAAFPGDLKTPTQPPLTRICRLVREEATPIFYQASNLQFRLLCVYNRAKKELRFNKEDHGFLASLSPKHLATIRKFTVTFRNALELGYHLYKIEVELKTGEKGFLPQVTACKPERTAGGRGEVDETCTKIVEALKDYFSLREPEEADGGKQRLTLGHLYAARRKLEEIVYAD